MFGTIKTLFNGSAARADETVRDIFAIEIIDQKVRETEAHLKGAKTTLATLIQRERTEARLLRSLQDQIADLEKRAKAAMDGGKEDLAMEAATAIATMENEATLRQKALDRLEQKITRLRTSVQTGHRKVIELKQGAMAAAAMRREVGAQAGLAKTGNPSASAQEAENMIKRVMGEDDPFEMGEIMDDINADLSGENIADRMANAGFGPATKSTANDVLARLKK